MHSVRLDDETTTKVKELESRMGAKTMAHVVRDAIRFLHDVTDKTPGNAFNDRYKSYILSFIPSDAGEYPPLLSEEKDIFPFPDRLKLYTGLLKQGINSDQAMIRVLAAMEKRSTEVSEGP